MTKNVFKSAIGAVILTVTPFVNAANVLVVLSDSDSLQLKGGESYNFV